jgi:hypothetical protein
MTVTPAGVEYSLPTNIDNTAPLANPSHSELHNDVNRAVLDLNARMSQVELTLAGLTAPDGSIEQARLVANTWYLTGAMSVTQTILMPLIWNVTERAATFKSAKAALLTPADTDVEVDLVVAAMLTGPTYDETTQTSILKAGKLVIPAGQNVSATLGESDFVANHPMNTYVAAYVEKVGSTDAPGADLTIQLNRNL